MINKIKTHVDLMKLEKMAKNLNFEEEDEDADTDSDIPEVPLVLEEEPEESSEQTPQGNVEPELGQTVQEQRQGPEQTPQANIN
jgi:hypothetical protein